MSPSLTVPTSLCSRRHSNRYLASRYIVKNDRSCTHDNVLADGNTLFDCCVETNVAIAPDNNVRCQRRSGSDVYMIAQDTIVLYNRC